MKTFTIILVTSAAMSLSGIASAADKNLNAGADTVVVSAAQKTAAKRNIKRKAIPAQNSAMLALSDKGWISVSKRSPAKTKIIQPKGLKTRTPVKFGQ